MKARDIVPGWPKSRSTLPSWENSKWEFDFCWINFCRVRTMFIEAYDPEPTYELLELDHLRDRLYHLRQREMVQEFVKDRLKYPNPQRDVFREAMTAMFYRK